MLRISAHSSISSLTQLQTQSQLMQKAHSCSLQLSSIPLVLTETRSNSQNFPSIVANHSNCTYALKAILYHLSNMTAILCKVCRATLHLASVDGVELHWQSIRCPCGALLSVHVTIDTMYVTVVDSKLKHKTIEFEQLESELQAV